MFATYVGPFVASYGLWAVFVIVMLESAGVPLPGETALVSAAIYAGATGGLRISEVIAVAAIAAILGDNIGFWMGRTWGKPLLRRYGHFARLDDRRIALGELLFARHGASIVFFGRFIAFLRIFAALLAGVCGLGWGRFLIFNAAGAITWALLFAMGGYIFGDTVVKLSGPVGILAFVAVVAGVIAFAWAARWQEDKYFEKLERESARATDPSPPAPQ